MGTFLLVLQILAAVIFVVLMAVQTDKAEQSGVMGLGGQGGRMMGAIDMPVGAERILRPLSKWTVVAFLFLSALSSMSSELQEKNQSLPIWVFLAAVAIYLLIMLMGDRVWSAFLRLFGPQN